MATPASEENNVTVLNAGNKGGDWEKGKYLINLYITDINGNKHQYGLVPLKASNDLHTMLMAKQEQFGDAEAFQSWLIENTTAVIHEVTEKPKAAF